ncbi:ABC transporter substrate-binding protein [Chloroflexota bacterium]
MKKLVSLLVTVLVTLAIVASGCAGSGTADLKGPITVGSKIDTEGALLSQVIILMLKDNGFGVVDKSQFGATSVVRKAIISGELDMYPEYTGNGAFFFAEDNSPVWKNARQGYERVKELDKAQNNIVWLTPAPANNTWAIAVPKTMADKENLTSLDDFAAYVNRGGYVKLIGSEEFATSPAALPAFQQAYGFTLQQSQLLVVSSGNTAQTERAAAQGTDGVNAAMAYGTDGSLSAFNLVVLSDPRGVQPVYEPAPIVRSEVYDKYPEIGTILEPVFTGFDLVTLQTLNGKIAVEGQNPTDVARDYLTGKGLLK